MLPSSTTLQRLCPWSPGELRILPRTLVYFEKSLPKPISVPCITPFKFCLNYFQRANRIETYGLNYKWMCSHWRSYSQISYPLGTTSISRHYLNVGHLLMNLKNNCLLKKLLKWANKKQCKNFNIYNVAFKKWKTPGDIIILQLCTKNRDDMIYSS